MAHARPVPEEFTIALLQMRRERDSLALVAARHAKVSQFIEALEAVFVSYGAPIPPETSQDAPDASEPEGPQLPNEQPVPAEATVTTKPPRKRATVDAAAVPTRRLRTVPDAAAGVQGTSPNHAGDPQPPSNGRSSVVERHTPNVLAGGPIPSARELITCRFCNVECASYAVRSGHEDGCEKRVMDRASTMHIHQWKLDPPKDGQVRQKCKTCGTEKYVPSEAKHPNSWGNQPLTKTESPE